MPIELFALVRMDGQGRIEQIVRTYESKERAELDLELLTEQVEGKSYEVTKVPHVER